MHLHYLNHHLQTSKDFLLQDALQLEGQGLNSVVGPYDEKEAFAYQQLDYYRTSFGVHFIRCFNGGD
jgi:hypothetical protein